MGVMDNHVSQEARDDRDAANPQPLATPIRDFYKDTKILITGATGFIGKALAEKLLRSCVNISTIYFLIRAKRGSSVQTRHEKIIKNSVFDTIRAENPALLKKLVCISGDVSEENLGMSDSDRERLIEEVDVVFHSAATVRFTEDMIIALQLNTIGTMKVIQLCRDLKNLKAFIHVSTAYSNADKPEILEKVYPTPASLEEVLDACAANDTATLRRLQGNHPNTYTMTKAMAEHIIETQASDLPVAIVRPSIVTGALQQPVPGWVDNVSGISGIMVEIGRGTLRSIICEEKYVMDVIPVDIVVDTLIAAAWQAHRQRSIRVYNCTSGTLNPVLWHDYGRMTEKHALRIPSKYVQWYPGFKFRTNRFVQFICEVFLHFLPALLVDAVMVARGMKPRMYTIARRFKSACNNGEFFAVNEWRFQCDNMVALNKELSDENDRAMFNVDVKQVEWDSYVYHYMMGLRRYTLFDGPESLPEARKKLNRLYWGSKICQVCGLAISCLLLRRWLF